MVRRSIVAMPVLLALAGAVSAVPLPRFPPGAVWNQDISGAPLASNSAQQIQTLMGLCAPPPNQAQCGFGFGRMQIDFGLHVVQAPAGAPTRTISGYPFDNYYAPDCEPVGTAMPVPANAAIEANADLTCDNASEDCHLLVVQGTTLYEAYHANGPVAGQLQAQCLAVWDLTYVYPPQGRGDHCTSADAAGFPIAPLLFNADEVFDAIQVGGDLGHAIRFILPNARMANDPAFGGVDGYLYVRPASHAGSPQGPSASVAYGSRLRLRSDFPLTNYSPGAQVVLRTMKRYGIVLADGGNIALTAESDMYTTHTWAEVGIDSRTFDQTAGATDVFASDFQVIDTGARIGETYDCVRTVVPTGVILKDSFEDP
jgi:serine/threonine-protein kinase